MESPIKVPNADVIKLNAQAMQALAARKVTEAQALLQEALKLDPNFLAGWLNLAAAQRLEGDFAAALSSVDSALKLQPLSFAALLMRGSLHEASGKPRMAAQAYNIAFTQLPPMDSLDEPTRRAVKHAMDIAARFQGEIESFFDAELRPKAKADSHAARRRMSQFVDHLTGKRRPFQQNPTSFFYPGLPSIEFYDREEFPWLEMVEQSTEAIRNELIAVLQDEAQQNELEPYMQRPPNEPTDQFTELNFSPRWSAYHFALYGKYYDEHRRACPKTTAILDQMPFPVVPNRMPAALFSILQPKTHIPPHTGAGNVRLLCHLPLILPPHCRFRCGNSLREWRMGEAFVFDDTIEHEAWNDSDQVRAVLIFDVWNPYLTAEEREFIVLAMSKMDEICED